MNYLPCIFTVANVYMFTVKFLFKLCSALATDQPPICDKVCGVAIGVGLTMFLLISFSLFMLWFTKKKNDRRKTNMKVITY